MEEELVFRLIFIGVFALVLSVSTYYRRLARKSGEAISRLQEGPLALTLRVVMTLPLLLAILFYAFIPRWMSWSAISLPIWVRWMGVGLSIACLPLVWWVFSSIGSNISETVMMLLSSAFPWTTTLQAARRQDAWTPPVAAMRKTTKVASYRARLAGDALLIEVTHEPGWHTYALDNLEAEGFIAARDQLVHVGL